MAARRPNPGRTLVVFFLVVALTYGLVALARGLEAQARARPPGRHPDHPDREGRRLQRQPRRGARHHRGPRQRLRCGRGRGLHPGQQVHRRRDPRREPPRPGRDRQASGPAALPGRRRRRQRRGRRRQHRCRTRARHRCPAPAPASGHEPTSPAPEGRRGQQPGAVRLGRERQRGQGKKHDETPSPSPDARRRPPRSRRRATARRRPADLDGQPRRQVAGCLQRVQLPGRRRAADVDDDPDKPLVTCDEFGQKMLLSAAMIEGTDLSSASTLPPSQQSVEWGVDLNFNGAGTNEFARISQALVNTEKQFAIVLDGRVISAPTMEGLITDGNAQITGQFTEAEARQPRDQPQVRRPADLLREGPAGRAGRPVARRQPALGRHHRRSRRPVPGDALLPVLLPRARPGRHRVAARGGRADLLAGGAAQRGRRLHAVAARHRRTDRRGRHHGRLLHRLLRTNPRRDARRQVDARRGRGGLGARPEHLPGRRRGLAARRAWCSTSSPPAW